MRLSVGEKLGPYEILAPIGAGGMGEVYRARDTRLNRDVAIKVSQERFSDRFEREARAVAALNHPNICTLFDVGPNYLVMELIDGESPKGPLPLDETLRIMRQIAAALDAAHEKGIIHRDLKPGNIKIKPDGTVKVLDFGLAKTVELTSGDPATSPTMTVSPTRAGMIMGTAAYMSPEQARGKIVDKRSDIWAFGVVLYELLTGRRPFHGEDLTDTLASVMKDKPDLSGVPGPARRLVESCLEKDPRKRLRDIGDAWIAIDAPHAGEGRPADPAPAESRWVRALPWAVAVLCLVAGAGSGYVWLHPPAVDLRASQFAVDAPTGSAFAEVFGSSAVSPDGRFLVFSARPNGSKDAVLWLRPIDSLNMRALSGTEGGDFPFWSPDSQSLAFFADRKLKRIGIAGGSPVTLCEVDPPGPAGGAWNQKGAVLFAGDDGVYQVSASGGVPARITQADAARHETAHGFPQFLPDGQRFLYFVQSPDVDVQGIYGAALDRPRGGSRILSTDHKALYSPPRGDHPGLLLWLRERALLAQPFDAGKLKLEGESTRLAENIAATTTATHSMAPSRAAFWLSNAGVLVYHTGAAAKRKLLWIGRDGKQIQEAAPEDEYTSLRLSPDSKRALVGRRDASDGKIDLWLLDLGRAVMTRLTVDGRETGFAVWSPDGRSVAYSSERRGVVQIYRKDAASGGLEEQLTDGPEPNYVTSWSHDGHYLFSTRVRGNTNDIWALPVKGVGPAGQKPFLAARIDSYAGSAAFSPDGKWMAYHSAESGRTEIYARPFTEAASGKTGKWQVSSQGGMSPKWRADGRELFYSTSGGIAAAAVRTGSGNFESDAPHDLFRGPGGREYDPSADGERFLVLAPIAAGPASASPLTVVVNWQVWLNK